MYIFIIIQPKFEENIYSEGSKPSNPYMSPLSIQVYHSRPWITKTSVYYHNWSESRPRHFFHRNNFHQFAELLFICPLNSSINSTLERLSYLLFLTSFVLNIFNNDFSQKCPNIGRRELLAGKVYSLTNSHHLGTSSPQSTFQFTSQHLS